VAAGAIAGRIAWDGPAALDPPGTVHLDDLGLGVDTTMLLSTGGAHLDYTTYELAFELGLTLAAVFRTDRFVWRVGAGVAVARLVGGGALVLSRTNVAEFEDLFGPAMRASVAWSLSPHLGMSVGVRVALLTADHLAFTPVGLLVALHFD
jgi:hypothetical protein